MKKVIFADDCRRCFQIGTDCWISPRPASSIQVPASENACSTISSQQNPSIPFNNPEDIFLQKNNHVNPRKNVNEESSHEHAFQTSCINYSSVLGLTSPRHAQCNRTHLHNLLVTSPSYMLDLDLWGLVLDIFHQMDPHTCVKRSMLLTKNKSPNASSMQFYEASRSEPNRQKLETSSE